MPLILCIEDEAALRNDLAEELRDAGYDVMEAAGGQEGLQALAAKQPDLVLCDISMPGLDGYQVLREIREKHPGMANVPFIFLTALADNSHIVEGKRRGADDYLVKPIDYDLLLATIHARLEQIARMHSVHESELVQRGASLVELLAAGAESAIKDAIQLLNYTRIGVVLLEDMRKVSYLNDYAQRLIARHDGLSLEQGLRAENKLLQEGIQAALKNSDRVKFPIMINLPRSSNLHPYVASIFPLWPVAHTAGSRSWAVVLISDPSEQLGMPLDLLGSLYGLTIAESKIAVGLLKGHEIKEIAHIQSITEGTARSHLKSIFAKTNTHRQAELVGLLGKLSFAAGSLSAE